MSSSVTCRTHLPAAQRLPLSLSLSLCLSLSPPLSPSLFLSLSLSLPFSLHLSHFGHTHTLTFSVHVHSLAHPLSCSHAHLAACLTPCHALNVCAQHTWHVPPGCVQQAPPRDTVFPDPDHPTRDCVPAYTELCPESVGHAVTSPMRVLAAPSENLGQLGQDEPAAE